MTENTDEKKDIRKLTLNISADMHKALRIRAAEEDTTMTALILAWIEAELKKARS